jgi:hypothetical protein
MGKKKPLARTLENMGDDMGKMLIRFREYYLQIGRDDRHRQPPENAEPDIGIPENIIAVRAQGGGTEFPHLIRQSVYHETPRSKQPFPVS